MALCPLDNATLVIVPEHPLHETGTVLRCPLDGTQYISYGLWLIPVPRAIATVTNNNVGEERILRAFINAEANLVLVTELGTTITISGGVAGAHQVLSATHTDTTVGAEVRGDMFIVGAAGTWTRLPIGINTRVVKSDGTDIAWGQVAHSELSGITAGDHHTAFVQADHDALPNPHHSNANDHAQSHNHSAAGDGTTLTPATLNIPNAVAPAPTAEGQVFWDNDDDKLIIGDGAGQRHVLPSASFSGDATVSTAGAVTVAATHSGSAHHAQSHTLTSHSTRAHSELTDITATDHHSNANDHTQSHNHSAAGDSTTLTPAILNIPNAAAPAPTAEGQAIWDNDDDKLVVGDGAGQRHILPSASFSGDATVSTVGAVTVAASHSGSAHHTQSHDHSAAGDGNSLVPTTLRVPNGAGGTLVDAAGEITNDTTSRTLNFYDGTAEVVLNPRQSKAFVLENPVATDDLPLWRTDAAITLVETDYLCIGGTNWIGQLQEADANGINGVDTQAADTTATAGTNVQVTSYSNATLDTGDYLRLKSTSISGTPTLLVVTVYFRQDP